MSFGAPLLACQKLSEEIGDKVVETAIEKAIEAKGGGEVSIDKDGDSVVVKSKDGSGEMRIGGAAASIPESWPSDVPPYPGGKVVMSLKMPKGWTLTLETEDAPEKVIAFYKDKLSGMEERMSADVKQTKTLVVAGDGKNVTVAATGEKEKTMVNLIVAVDERSAKKASAE